jgi:hypothetical protein
MKKLLLYTIRWQFSSPIIALVLIKFAYLGTFKATILANFIGALIFFWIDKWIFNRNIYFKR